MSYQLHAEDVIYMAFLANIIAFENNSTREQLMSHRSPAEGVGQCHQPFFEYKHRLAE